ncbi:MAG TPA: glycerol-3-phosphate dehydrogenase/oxidase [Microbacteriaceae bacterium]
MHSHHESTDAGGRGLRARSTAALRTVQKAQVVIVGGGINGIATFRDLALQNVNVVLVERGDWCSGASAASSHMIHGGIRYLENGEFRLVKESVQERNGLLEIAPHYVKPLKTTVPIYSTFAGLLAAPLRFLTHKAGRPSERGALLIKVGLVLYDSFSRNGGRVPRHAFRGRSRSLAELPRLNPAVKYTATYFDASVHEPERLALDILQDGIAAGDHARAANYVEAIGLDDDGVRLRDTVTGQLFSIKADVVINATGPWTDLTNNAFGTSSEFMGGTKGSHIVLDSPELLAACDGRELFFEHRDGRIVLIYPLNGRVLVGTTDLEADVRTPAVCTAAEVDYFFELINHVFPTVSVTREQIVFRFAGIRPLPKHDDTQPGFVSRDYRIECSSIGGVASDAGTTATTTVLSLVGGKWTTFRALAERLSDETLALLGGTRVRSTAALPIGGGVGFPTTEAAHAVWIASHADEVGRQRAEQLLARYGTKAEAVIEATAEFDGGAADSPLENAPAFGRAEIEFIVRAEHVVHLADLVLRRTNLAFTGQVTVPLLQELAELAGGVLGWDDATRETEVSTTTLLLAERYGVRMDVAQQAVATSIR